MSFWSRLLDFRFVAPKPKKLWRAAYAGAEQNRLNLFNASGLQSPTSELRYELATLRSRSRDLCRNNPLAHRFLALHAENVVGRDGIALQARAETRKGEPDEDANERIEDAWWLWGRDLRCTIDHSSNWPGFLQRVAALRAMDGEVFVRLIDRGDNDARFSVQLIDPDRVDLDLNEQNPDGSAKIVMGVEVDSYGAPVAYHVLRNHPNEIGAQRKTYERVPVADLLHIHRPFRPNQYRGVPDTAAVLTTTQMLDGYVFAALTEARTAASKQGFIQQGPDADAPDPDSGAAQSRVTETSPGSVDVLGPGETFVGWDPKSPSGNFGPFVLANTQWIAAGLNVSYMALTGDLSNTSYSSSRTGLLQERDAWRILQSELAAQLCDPVYRRWLKQARLAQALKLPYDSAARYEVVEWKGRSWDWVDPEKDVTAGALAVAYGFKSPQEVVAEQGKDLRDVYAQIAAAKEMAESMDIEIASPSGASVPAEPEPEPEPAEPVVDEAAAEDRKQVAEAMRQVAGAMLFLSREEKVPPVVNVAAPIVNVAPPNVDVRVGGPKKGSELVVQRDADGLVTGASWQEPAGSEA